MMRCDCFFRRQNRNKAKMFSPENVREVVVEVAIGATLEQILAAAIAAGASRGTFQSGIFEVQTDLGIFRRPDSMRLDPVKDAERTFKTWEQLEAEEMSA